MLTEDALRALALHRTDEVVMAAMTSAVLWPRLSDHPRDLIYVPSTMGGVSSLGLGLALARPDRRVVVLNGDGSMLMNLGSLVTIADQSPPNLVLIVFDNGIYAVTGGQTAPGAGQVDFAAIARAAGWPCVQRFSELEEWTAAVPDLLSQPGPILVHLKVEPEPRSISAPPIPMRRRLPAFREALA